MYADMQCMQHFFTCINLEPIKIFILDRISITNGDILSVINRVWKLLVHFIVVLKNTLFKVEIWLSSLKTTD